MRFGWLLPKKIENFVFSDFWFGEVFFSGMTLTDQIFFLFTRFCAHYKLIIAFSKFLLFVEKKRKN